jgi:hypothetical protein
MATLIGLGLPNKKKESAEQIKLGVRDVLLCSDGSEWRGRDGPDSGRWNLCKEAPTERTIRARCSC